MLDIQKHIWAPKIIENHIDDVTTSFEITNLPGWVAHTLWNAMRRIMLWYDIWWSVTWLVIRGVSHEYMVLDGMKESVIDVMLNYKILRFRVDDVVEPLIRISQKFKWVGQYTSDHLQLPSGVVLLSSNIPLFEITDPSIEFSVEMRVEKGYGYYSIDFLRSREKKQQHTEQNILLIDNDFKLVDYVKYDVNKVIEDFSWAMKDHLIIEVRMWFNGVSPKDFLTYAWELLASYAKLFIYEDAYIDRSVFVEYDSLVATSGKLLEEANVKTMPIDALPLSERTRNALIKNKILYVEDLEKQKKNELLLMKWVWRKAVDEISVALWNMWKSLLNA